MSTIPASELVTVLPNVLAAGGSALDLIGLILTNSTRVPIGTVQSFPDGSSVDDYFGATSDEAIKAGVYFAGFDDSNVKPGAILFAQYPSSAVAAYVRGGDLSAMTLAQLQALNGTLSIAINGVPHSASISLAAATSFSNAGILIADALNLIGVALITFSGSISGTTLTVGTIGSDVLAVGQVLTGTGIVAGTYITALASGTGGVGTYTVSDSQNAIAQAITAHGLAVQYDSVSGGFEILSGTAGNTSTIAFGSGALSTSLLLTEVTGAVLSQGTAAATPSAFMDAIVNVTQNWVTFTTLFNPDSSGNDNKYAFAGWANGTSDRFSYVCWDTDASPTVSNPATSSLGYRITQANYSGTFLLYAPDATLSAFVCGIGASIDFAQTDGRTTFAYRRQAGLTASVTDAAAANNLGGNPQTPANRGNGYNFYGAYATANDNFTFLQRGFVSGRFLWMDSYLNQIWLNNAFQLALVELLQSSKSIPYNSAGRAKIEAALADPINAGLSFGAFRAGVALSASQRAAVNAAAGGDIAVTLETRGWYLQVGTATASVRQNRGTPPCTFWYMDGESIQSLSLTSVAVL